MKADVGYGAGFNKESVADVMQTTNKELALGKELEALAACCRLERHVGYCNTRISGCRAVLQITELGIKSPVT